MKSLADIEGAAQSLREFWNLGLGPLPSLTELLEDKGIRVLWVELPEEIDSLLCNIKQEDTVTEPAIALNPLMRASSEKQRFALARQIGNLRLDCDRKLSKEQSSICFARAFLVPATALRQALGRHPDRLGVARLLELKTLFGTRAQILVGRCRDLRIIEESHVDALSDALNEEGSGHPELHESTAVNREPPTRFERLCLRALSERSISESKSAELRRTSVRQLNV